MSRTYRLERTQVVPLPRAEVFAFFSDAGNLEAITPESLGFHIVTPRPIAMRAGTTIDYRLRLFGVPFTWRTLIEEFNPPHEFVDVQVRGPYKLWRHRHRFEETPEGTLMRDLVEYQLPLGPLGVLTHALFVRRTLDHIFEFRRAQIAQHFSSQLAA